MKNNLASFQRKNSKNSKGQENQKIPDMNEFEMFWGNIWKKPDSINREKWSEFMSIMSLHVNVENEGGKEPDATMKML